MPVSYSGTAITWPDSSTTTSGWTGFKNRLINGQMQIDQRNAGASVTPTTNGTYTLDRWAADLSQSSKFSVQQNAGSVTPPAGFSKYLGVTSTSAYTVGSTENFLIHQAVEGFNFADLGFGTASAATVTLSFWVRSSLTGTFGGSLTNATVNRCYPYSYTISAANTWEQKSVTIAGDTTGTWVGATNGIGCYLFFNLGTGSSKSGTAGSWSSSELYAPTGATSVVGTNGATLYITGVQLERGSTASSFEYRPYGTELALCQRYCFVANSGGSFGGVGTGYTIDASSANISIFHPVVMRSAPTLGTYSSGSNKWYIQAWNSNYNPNMSMAMQSASASMSSLTLSGSSGMTGGQPCKLIDQGSAQIITLSAEL